MPTIYINFQLMTGTKAEVDCLVASGILFQDFAPEYLIDRRPYCKVFSRVIKHCLYIKEYLYCFLSLLLRAVERVFSESKMQGNKESAEPHTTRRRVLT